MEPLDQMAMLQGVPPNFEGMITNQTNVHSEYKGG